ncbi:hypothetical protein DYY67_0508 [Candidatus Nitrosotalea sp. TS]|nr:hypothetical protein [Candidatus Nitrosotalea sp. TS]
MTRYLIKATESDQIDKVLPWYHKDMEKLRACPICPNCGSRKFDKIKAKDTIVRCVKCGKEMTI